MFCQASSEISLFLKSFEDERHSRRMLYCVNYSLLQVLLFPTFPKNNFKQRNSLNITFNYVDVYRQLIDVATSTYYSIMSCQSSYFFVYFVIKEMPAHMWHDMAAAYKGTASQLWQYLMLFKNEYISHWRWNYYKLDKYWWKKYEQWIFIYLGFK